MTQDARRPAPRLDGDMAVIAWRRRGQLIPTQAGVAGRPVEAVIDTGSEITIGNSALRNRLARGKKLEELDVTGVTGVTIGMPILRLAEIRVGPILVREVPIAFFDVPPFAAFGPEDRPAMLPGTESDGKLSPYFARFPAPGGSFSAEALHIDRHHDPDDWLGVTAVSD